MMIMADQWYQIGNIRFDNGVLYMSIIIGLVGFFTLAGMRRRR